MNKYIKAEKAIKAIMDMKDCYNGFSDTYDKAAIIGALEEVPGEHVQPVRFGRWIDTEFGWKCSECASLKDGYKRPAYCPNCGAKMEECENESR